uniref:Uncharacterized protein n=1 Tax=Vannella robusta TaxID=1487602 RepID=A0A7S4HL67_9EUKA
MRSVDLTLDGGDRFRVRLECDIGATVTIRVYSNGGVSEASFSVGRLVGLQNVLIPFSAFDGNPDFTNVGAIELFIPFDENLDLGIQEFDIATGSSPNGAPSLFVRPVEDYYIDYELGCERKVQSTISFTISSTDSGSAMLLPGFVSFIALFMLCVL